MLDLAPLWVRLILWYDWWGMLEKLQSILNARWHQKVHLLVGIIPFDGKSAISLPYFFEQAHIIFLHHLYQVLGMFFPNVFYPKVVDDKRKSDWTPLTHPQPRHCFALGLAMLLQPFCQELLGNDPHLQEPIHALEDFTVDVPIGCCNVKQLIMFKDVLRHIGEF
jgi:hypothetical protein